MTEISSNGKIARGNGQGLWAWLRSLFRDRPEDAPLRKALEEIIEEIGENGSEEDSGPPISDEERVMLANMLKFRHLTVYDVMVPRADIVAVPAESAVQELVEVIRTAGHSRVPIFQETLDDVVGMVHVRDLIPWLARPEGFKLATISRDVLFVAPSMRLLDLLLEMRRSRIHLALVVDEFGGIDGLVTIEDLIEQIIGEVGDEHDEEEETQLIRRPDGSFLADARLPIEVFEAEFGPVLDDDQRDDVDTLGGLVFSMTGRIPARGELMRHPAGFEIEVADADPRRIRRLRVRRVAAESEEGNAG